VVAGADIEFLLQARHEPGAGARAVVRQDDLEQVPVAELPKACTGSWAPVLRFEVGAEAVEVVARQRGAVGGQRFQVLHLAQADGRHDVAHIVFAAEDIDVDAVHAAAGHALQAVFLGQARFFQVVQHQAAAFAGGDVLVGLEAERDEVAEGTDALAIPGGAEGLGRIFDHAQLVFVGDGVQAVHVDRQAGQVDRDDGAGARGDRRFQFVQVDVAGDRVDVGEHRGGADFDDDVGGGRPGNRGGDHFVARPDAGDAQGDLHGAGAGIEGAYRAAAEVLGQQGLEGLVLRPAGDPAGAQHLADGGDGFFVDGRPGKGQEGQLCVMESSWFLGWLLGEAIGLPSDIYSKRAL
jgi:hypothetical protein